MCCLVAVLLLIGPRAGLIFWWLFDNGRFDRAFETWFWPLLGFLFLPWTTAAYLFVFPGGVEGLDWVLVALGVLGDLTSYGGGARGRARAY
jgi:hypothetical protein